ncbi:MAG: DNA gyrase subunit A, partial [Glaciecola sp.]
DALHHYLAHQRDVLTRRTKHRLAKAEARAHILEGLLKALDHLDEVIALIRASDSSGEAKLNLMSRFAFSEIQADAVLSMQLRKLARLERGEIEDEYQELQGRIAELRAILKDPDLLDKVLVDELKEIRRVHANPRRSRIVADTGVQPGDDVIIDSPMGEAFEAQDVTVVVTRGGYVKPMISRRTTPAHKHSSDPVVAVIRCTTADKLLMVDASGMGWRIELADFPVVQPRQRGTLAAQVLGQGPEAAVVGAMVLTEAATVVTVSESGQLKRTASAEFDTRQRSLQASGLKGDDRLAAATVCGDDDDILLATDDGQITRFSASEVRAMGRTASGVGGMNVAKGAKIVTLSIAPGGTNDGEVVTIGADGSAKRTPLAEYAVKGRGGKGVQAGAAPLLFAGVAIDVHVHGSEPRLVRSAEITEARRTGSGSTLTGNVAGPVSAEFGQQAE